MVNAGHEEICWTEEGDVVLVKNAERLASRVLPQYFRHSQYASWVRALNAYGFRKDGADRWKHPSFKRGEPALLNGIRRKPSVRGAAKKAAAASEGGAAGRDGVLAGIGPGELSASALGGKRGRSALVQRDLAALEDEVQRARDMQREITRLEDELKRARDDDVRPPDRPTLPPPDPPASQPQPHPASPHPARHPRPAPRPAPPRRPAS